MTLSIARILSIALVTHHSVNLINLCKQKRDRKNKVPSKLPYPKHQVQHNDVPSRPER